MKLKRFSADFETNNHVNDCRVWAWGVIEIGKESMSYGNNIDTFFDFIFKNRGIYYFHNIGFDGFFLLSWLFKNDYEYSKEKKEKSFRSIISKSNKFYQLTIYPEKGKEIKFIDSYKILPFSVADIGRDFNLGVEKLKIDYNEVREIGHELTPEEVEYLKHDVLIIAKAMEVQLNQGLKKITAGSNALHNFKETVGYKWDEYFPVLNLDYDAWIRKAYKGGFVATNKKYEKKIHGNGLIFDVNSLYPSVMYENMLPYGYPIPFDGDYEYDKDYPLYILHFWSEFKIKKDKIPMLQIKKNAYYLDTEYVRESVAPTELFMTNVELELFKEHYDIFYMDIKDGFKFQQRNDIFRPYIDYWMTIKKENEGSIRQLAKLMLNSLYGKFATNPDVTGKIPYLDENEIVKLKLSEPETREPVYTAVGVFVTAYARLKTIRTSQVNYDRWLYSDTDSIHILGDELPDIDIDQKRLGAWKLENKFSRAVYLRPKTYMEEIVIPEETYNKKQDEYRKWNDCDNKLLYKKDNECFMLDVKCAGMTDIQKQFCTFDNFHVGLNIPTGKLRPKHVKGGIVLEDTSFKMRNK